MSTPALKAAAAPTVSLADLDARAKSCSAFEFEYILPNGDGSGVFLSVLGGQSPGVTEEVNRLLNDRRRREAAAEIRARSGGRKTEIEITTVESDIDFGHRLAAVRLVGWRGIQEAFSPDLALALCKSNQDISAQVTEQSNNVANFMKISSAN
ncbi:MAG: hypothetical protein JWP92_1806 [Caulobacter sp.]|nr:hypothetical protein [Caulobacter sp.]